MCECVVLVLCKPIDVWHMCISLASALFPHNPIDVPVFVCRCMSIWVYGCMGVWVHVFMCVC